MPFWRLFWSCTGVYRVCHNEGDPSGVPIARILSILGPYCGPPYMEISMPPKLLSCSLCSQKKHMLSLCCEVLAPCILSEIGVWTLTSFSRSMRIHPSFWVAVWELNFRCYNGGTIVFDMYMCIYIYASW